jgi:hypothetical protein
MTYLNIVNNVLRRLREEEVTTVTENTYSTMVGDFVNDAKTLVEQAADWSGLRTTTSVFIVADDNVYSLTGSGDDVKVMSAYSYLTATGTGPGNLLQYQTKDWFNDQQYINKSLVTAAKGGVTGKPLYYTFDGLDDNGDTQIRLYPMPDASYGGRFQLVKRQADLVNNTDVLLVPSKPVIHLAVALLARERGETGGTSTAEYFSIADKYLSDAIAIDAAKHPEEMIFRTI